METELACKIGRALETGVRGLREIELEATIVPTMGDLHHHEAQVEEPTEIEIEKVIGRLAMTVEAGVKVRQGPGRHTLGDRQAKKSYWKGYR